MMVPEHSRDLHRQPRGGEDRHEGGGRASDVRHPRAGRQVAGDRGRGRQREGVPRTGERVDLPEDEITAMNASFRDYSDCIDPIAVAATKGGEGEGKKTAKTAEAKEVKPAEGGEHGSAPAKEPAAPEAAPGAGH